MSKAPASPNPRKGIATTEPDCIPLGKGGVGHLSIRNVGVNTLWISFLGPWSFRHPNEEVPPNTWRDASGVVIDADTGEVVEEWYDVACGTSYDDDMQVHDLWVKTMNGITSYNLLPIKWMQMDLAVEPGLYRHFKGNEYRVLGVAKDSESGERMVVYARHGQLWVRPMTMFTETVDYRGSRVPRFQPLADRPLSELKFWAWCWQQAQHCPANSFRRVFWMKLGSLGLELEQVVAGEAPVEEPYSLVLPFYFRIVKGGVELGRFTPNEVAELFNYPATRVCLMALNPTGTAHLATEDGVVSVYLERNRAEAQVEQKAGDA